MKVTLRFFSLLRDRMGCEEKIFEADGQKSAREIFDGIFDEKYLPYTRFAVNWEYVPPDTILRDGDELAFIPPVSGG